MPTQPFTIGPNGEPILASHVGGGCLRRGRARVGDVSSTRLSTYQVFRRGFWSADREGAYDVIAQEYCLPRVGCLCFSLVNLLHDEVEPMLERRNLRSLQKSLIAAAVIGGCYLLLSGAAAPAYEILGTGTGALIGNDLTDLDNDGAPDLDEGYDAIFDSNEEPGFGGGEYAFNVFDNRLGPGNDKWCCGPAAIPAEGLWVSAEFSGPHVLTSFTVSSANDVPDRDPIEWAVQGSNNGEDYTDIYVFDEGLSLWDLRLQVNHFIAGDDFPIQTEGYEFFRFVTYNTVVNHQVGEIEYFGRPGASADGTPATFIAGVGRIGQKIFESELSNVVLGPAQSGVPGWSVLLVDTDLTVNNHTDAEAVLDDLDGDVSTGLLPDANDLVPYPEVNMPPLTGQTGQFGGDYAYPNGVTDNSMEDFAVRVEADVVIPAGRWTIGFGSDDGGQLTIPGVAFDDLERQ